MLRKRKFRCIRQLTTMWVIIEFRTLDRVSEPWTGCPNLGQRVRTLVRVTELWTGCPYWRKNILYDDIWIIPLSILCLLFLGFVCMALSFSPFFLHELFLCALQNSVTWRTLRKRASKTPAMALELHDPPMQLIHYLCFSPTHDRDIYSGGS